MDNLVASGNRSYGLFAKGCLGGKMVNSAGFHQGDSAYYVGETPCDKTNFTVHGTETKPCQKKPQWTTLKNDESYENVLGYSGTNSKYVRIIESDFFNNGAGIVPNTLDSEGYEPNGWNVFEKNNVFWNNYNYFLAASSFKTVSGGLGKLGNITVNYPTGVGIVLYGGDANVVKQNNVFGNYKWGIASFSGPGEVYVANQGDEAKNVNNQIVENAMGRDGTDPNGEFDFWNDGSGGGNCWGGNTAGASLAPGNGKVPLAKLYPACPQAAVEYDKVSSLDARSRPAAEPCRRKRPENHPRLRRLEPAAEPAVLMGPQGPGPSGVRKIHSRRGSRGGRRTDVQMRRPRRHPGSVARARRHRRGIHGRRDRGDGEGARGHREQGAEAGAGLGRRLLLRAQQGDDQEGRLGQVGLGVDQLPAA